MSTRNSMISLLALLLVAMSMITFAQAPTGTITGTVADDSGAVVPNASVTITNKATGAARTVITNSEGFYSAPSLPAGEYEVKAEFKGFRATLRPATVQTGESTQVNMPMTVGATGETVTVEGASAQINYESHNIQGVIPRSTIQDLPLNGRSYLQLAQLEPGVTVASGTVAQFNVLFTVSVLGAGNRTAVTIDGGNVSDNIDVGGGMSSMNFSQETVQEFQLSEVNFDLATPIAAGGAINVVTRSGSNDWHGSGYYFFRDHNMAAYPGLKRLAQTPDPFFVRRNPGGSFGGPIKKDKLFFFFNYEYLNQVQAISVTTTSQFLSALQGTYGSPYASKQISGRLDYHINDKHNAFLRYSHDGNSGFGQSLEFGDPSNWPHNTNWADQAIIGVTSLLTPRLVNDVRFQYNYWNNHNLQAVPSDCASPCFAGVLPNIFTFLGTNLPAVGPNFNAPQGRNTRRFELVENLSWQKGNHRFKFGGDLNPTKSAGLWGFCTPQCTGAFSPDYLANAFGGSAVAAAVFGASVFNIKTDKDLLNLPVLNIGSSIFSGVGVGSVPLPGAYDYDQNKHYNQFRAYFQDVWKLKPNFTINYGLAWNAQIGFYNSDLPRPQFLAPILGSGNLGPTENNTREFQPAIGFAWSPFKDNKTVIRGGAGIYWDSTPGYYKLREAASIGPPGSARNTLAASAFTNNIAGPFGGSGLINFAGPGPCPIPGFPASACSVVPFGAPLPLSALTNMTVGQFTTLVQQELPAIAAILSPSNPIRSGPFPYPNINFAKQGVEIYPQNFPLARSYQTSIGVQRDLGHGMVINVDYARRQGENVSLGEVDQNLFTRYQGSSVPVPVIPLCPKIPDFDPTHNCSTGSITFWTDQGRAIYNGMLLKLQKRMANHFQYLVSYAFQKATTENVWDNTNYMAGYGEYLPHHNLTVAGTVTLPWHFTLSLNSSFISRTPINPQVNGLILPGTVPSGSSEPLPGIKYGSINVGSGKADLQKAVDAYNSTIVGTKNAQGSTIASQLIVPPDYQFNDPTITQDFRLTYTYTYKERYKFNILAEMFNAFNISNLTGYSSTLDAKNTSPLCAGNTPQPGCPQTFAFGQPTQRVNQTFGSAGPRALQVGARFTF
jgi:hypothetical protein